MLYRITVEFDVAVIEEAAERRLAGECIADRPLGKLAFQPLFRGLDALRGIDTLTHWLRYARDVIVAHELNPSKTPSFSTSNFPAWRLALCPVHLVQELQGLPR